jgi:alkanesulfonate monooxygenase SsuD/methylene tetrahydromethanopterin reductase-like flavin-dependent oxidoreductase (luciferase family)
MLDQVSSCSSVGTVDQVRGDLEAFVRQTGADELIIVAQIYDHEARLRSYELAIEATPGLQ